jgi:hypothetical protein
MVGGFLLLFLFSCPEQQDSAATAWNLPEALRKPVQRDSFDTRYEVGDWLNPFYLRGDFDGDGKPDYAVLVVERGIGKKGIAIWLSGRKSQEPIFVGAGTKTAAGSEESDDWNFFDAWQVYMRRKVEQGAGRPPVLRGEAILIERSESASGLLYWDGNRFRWYQQGD